MGVPVETSSTEITLGAAVALFDFAGQSIVPQGNSFQYAAAPDGKRFLVNTRVGGSDPVVHVITNWRPTNK
jgi:hypothetical protein